MHLVHRHFDNLCIAIESHNSAIDHLILDFLCQQDNGIWSFDSGVTGKKISLDCNNICAEEVYDLMLQHAKIIKNQFCDGQGGYKGGIDKHLPDDMGDDGESGGKSTSEEASNDQYWKQKAAEAQSNAKMRGKGSAAIDRELNSILEPKVDWRKMLHRFMTKDIPVDFTMRRPGRRYYATGNYMPTVLKENLEVLVGVDCSGSIDYSPGSEGNQFISEVVGIAYAFPQIKMRIVAWASSVLPEDDIEVTAQNRERLKNWQPKNCGGTDLTCFTEWCKDHNYGTSKVCVILTDGYIERNPKLPKNMTPLFVLSENSSDEIVKKLGHVTSLKHREDR